MRRRSESSLASRLQALRSQRTGLAVAPNQEHVDESRGPQPAPIDARAAVIALDRARRARVRPAPELSISSEVDDAARLIRSVQRGLIGAGVAWRDLLTQAGFDDRLVRSTTVRSFRRGVVTIQVRDAAARYELARLLRAGGESRLAALAPVALHKVRLVP